MFKVSSVVKDTIKFCKITLSIIALMGLFTFHVANSEITEDDVFGTGDDVEISKKLILAEKNPIAAIMCKALFAAQSVTQIVAVLVVIIMGAAFLLGKISWGVVIATMIATVLALSSDIIIGSFVGDAGKGAGGGEGASACDCKYGIACTNDE